MTSNQLNEFLRSVDLKDHEFAKLIGVGKTTVHHWLHERRSIPETVARIAVYFETYPDRINDFLLCNRMHIEMEGN